MPDFAFYFKIGWQHIISWEALDHLLFILALSAIYLLSNWKQLLVLVTAFTVGHSLTLALSVYEIIRINDKLAELLIPVTILITAVFNFFQKDFTPKGLRLNYFLALFFGLIHGLGFANTLRFMLAKDQQIGWSLFSFNLGLEAGQIVVVASIISVSYLAVNRLLVKRKWWVWTLSGVAFRLALKMIIERAWG
jgi:HupE / UreJ protein